MPKIKTTKGIINNNTIKHKITKDTATIFNFCIDEVTLDDDTLTVACTTLLGDTVEYSLDISSDTKELPSVLENLNVAGDVNLFLALAYRIYEAGLEQSEDTPSADCTELQARIAELEAQLPTNSTVSENIHFDIEDITFQMTGYSKVTDSNIMDKTGYITLLIPGTYTSYEKNAFDEKASTLTEIKSLKINDNTVTINGITYLTIGNMRGFSFTSTEQIQETLGPVKFTVEILNKQTNTTVILEDTFDTSTQEWTGGGEIINYNPIWTERVAPVENGSPLVLTCDIQNARRVNQLEDVEFLLNNEIISPTSRNYDNTTNVLSYTLTVQYADLEAENTFQVHIKGTDDTMETTDTYTYTLGGGELTLNPYVTIQPTVTTIKRNTSGAIMATITPYNLSDGETILIKTIIDPENNTPVTGGSNMIQLSSEQTIPLSLMKRNYWERSVFLIRQKERKCWRNLNCL